MTTVALKIIELRCPNCGNEFTSKAIQADGAAGRQHTDFHVRTSGIEPLRYGVHLCGRCGYASREDGFSQRGEVSYEVQQRVWDELAPRLSAAASPASEKYEFAAKVATWDGADPLTVGDLWLRAAWCCVEEGDIEAERYYRQYAVQSFEEALESYDRIDPNDRAKITYLVGELWRRIGDGARAKAWFERVPDEANRAGDGTWVRWAERQHANPSEWFV